MFMCTKLIEETGWILGLIFAWIGEVRGLEKIHTFDGVMMELSHF